MLRRTATPVLFFLFGLCAFLLIQGALSFHESHCGPENQQKTIQAPTNENAQSPSAHEQGGNRDRKEAHKESGHPVVCGITGLYGIVSLMDAHEGFFVGLFTFMLFIATALLWRATNDLWDAGERQLRTTRSVAAVHARNTQHQIRLARDEFVAAHRPEFAAQTYVVCDQ
jgi:hypothetical protein